VCPDVKLHQCVFGYDTRSYCGAQLFSGSGHIVKFVGCVRTSRYVEQAKEVIIPLSHICDLAGIFYEGPKSCQSGIVLKSRYIAQHLFQHPKITCPASHFNSKVASKEVIYSQVQLLHILHKITSGLIDIGKESNGARECILDVLGKAGPLFLIRLELLHIEYDSEHYGRSHIDLLERAISGIYESISSSRDDV
jgi:hypothetical protein